jgi:hypothetical protein
MNWAHNSSKHEIIKQKSLRRHKINVNTEIGPHIPVKLKY